MENDTFKLPLLAMKLLDTKVSWQSVTSLGSTLLLTASLASEIG